MSGSGSGAPGVVERASKEISRRIHSLGFSSSGSSSSKQAAGGGSKVSSSSSEQDKLNGNESAENASGGGGGSGGTSRATSAASKVGYNQCCGQGIYDAQFWDPNFAGKPIVKKHSPVQSNPEKEPR